MAVEYQRLRTMHQLQKNMVRQYMHNAMSPISAISGYLELLNMSLYSDGSKDQLEQYRKKIQRGVNEVNSILEQLQDIYSEDGEEDGRNHAMAMDINWIVGEVCNQMTPSCGPIIVNGTVKPVYVVADMLVLKMMLTNLVNKARKNTPKDQPIEIDTHQTTDEAVVKVRFRAGAKVRQKLQRLFAPEAELDLDEIQHMNSFTKGLVASAHMAKQHDSKICYREMDDNRVEFNLRMPLGQRAH